MIKQILTMLAVEDYYNVSEEVEIAKGRNSIPRSFKEGMKLIKRDLKYKK